MKKTSIVCTLLVLAAATASAQDPVKVAPNQVKVVLENDYVRVLSWTENPGDKTPMHEHPALVSVSFSDGKTRFTLPDGKTRETTSKAGQATWSGPEKHASENLATERGQVIQVELKRKPAAAQTQLAAAEDSVAVDPKHYKVEFQNDRVRVLRIHYGPNEKSVMHAHPASLAVFMSETHGKFTFPDGTTAPADRKAGDVQWTDAGKHLPENIGTTPFEVILVELR